MDWGLAYGFKKSNYIVFKRNYSTSLQLMDNSFSYIVNNALMFGKGKDYRKALRGIYQAGICAGNASYNHELGNVERYQYLGVALEYTLILSYPNFAISISPFANLRPHPDAGIVFRTNWGVIRRKKIVIE